MCPLMKETSVGLDRLILKGDPVVTILRDPKGRVEGEERSCVSLISSLEEATKVTDLGHCINRHRMPNIEVFPL